MPGRKWVVLVIKMQIWEWIQTIISIPVENKRIVMRPYLTEMRIGLTPQKQWTIWVISKWDTLDTKCRIQIIHRWLDWLARMMSRTTPTPPCRITWALNTLVGFHEEDPLKCRWWRTAKDKEEIWLAQTRALGSIPIWECLKLYHLSWIPTRVMNIKEACKEKLGLI